MIVEYLHNNECDVVVSLVAPYRWLREEFKERIGFDNFQEFYVHTTEKEKETIIIQKTMRPELEFIDVETTKDTPENLLKNNKPSY